MEIIGMEANAYEKSIRELNQFLDRIDRLLESTSPKPSANGLTTKRHV